MQAQIYEEEGDHEQAYFLLFRHAHLVLTNLAAHPGIRDKEIKPLFAQAQREVNVNLKRLDQLRPRIKERYERYNNLVKEREARNRAAQVAGRPQSPDRTAPPPVRHLQAHENRDLAVQLHQREISRRAGSRRAREEEDDNDLSRQLQNIRAQVEPSRRQQPISDYDQPQTLRHGDSYKYPTVQSRRTEDSHQPEISGVHGVELDSRQVRFDSHPPALPPKPASQSAPAAPLPPAKVPTQPDRDQTKTPSYTFTSTARLEDGTALRTIFLPPTLRTTFLRLAYKNTQANLETCAFLAGTLISNALFVSKLIVPSQTSTSDTCEMTNESQLFDLVDAEADLMILGWIHTHPTQTCFMSSRDLHTHAGYQMMLAESIAIVCAPSKGDTTHGGEWGIYRLTDPPGKKAILACQKPGIFHPHDVENTYTDALRPGHVVEAKGLEFDVVDLREG
jgi:STAM-binding protein